jgi:putative Mn2+ efflux pump MntP
MALQKGDLLMLGIAGLVAIVVFTYQAYKTAAGTDRNPILWSVATAAIGIGFQFFIPLLIGIVLAIYYMATGTPAERLEDEISGIAGVFGLVCLVLSIVGMVLVMKHVSKVRDDGSDAMAPPPPPNFS